jgi:hypothetical protein
MTRSSPVSQGVAWIAGAWVTAFASVAVAETRTPSETPVDVKLAESPPPRRVVSVEWSPLPLFTIGKLSANVVIVPIDHHALVLSPFYASTTTQPITVVTADGSVSQPSPAGSTCTLAVPCTMVLPKQTFWGVGGEVGYRYYTEGRGARGFFIGPSFILGVMTAKAQNGDKLGYLDLGGALDIGWQTIIADSITVSFGVGVQFTAPDKSIPNQQFPADVYANTRVLPRALASIGLAF